MQKVDQVTLVDDKQIGCCHRPSEHRWIWLFLIGLLSLQIISILYMTGERQQMNQQFSSACSCKHDQHLSDANTIQSYNQSLIDSLNPVHSRKKRKADKQKVNY